MSAKWELVLRIDPDERSIRVEEINDGVTAFMPIGFKTCWRNVKMLNAVCDKFLRHKIVKTFRPF